MTVRIVTDSTCDLPAETIARYRIYIAPLYINVGNQGYLDGIDITREQYYQQLPSFPTHPTTAVPSPNKLRALYDQLREEGATEILSIHISSALSAFMDIAHIAAKETTSVPVTAIDSQQISLGTGFLVEKAAQLAEAGRSVAEILPVLMSQIKRSHVFAALDTLEFLKRSGRMNKYVAGLGSLLQLKAILTMHNGKPGTLKVRTRENAIKRLMELLHALGPLERLAIVHGHAHDRVAELRALVGNLFPQEQILVSDITPVIGTHIGPGAYGFAAVGAEG